MALLLVLLAFAAAWVGLPSAAQARDYSVDKVDIDLTVGADGSLSVTEERTFDFDGSFNGVYWDISTEGPAERSSDEPMELTVTDVEDLTTGGGAFAQSASGAEGTYELLSQGPSVTRLKIYAPHEDETATIRISYVVTNAVSAWADTGELYWKFVSDGWEVASDDVTCRVHLPVPAGETVMAGDNVRAWGHGPLDASLAFDGEDVVYTVPGVGSGEFAEARVTFPVAWLTDVQPSDEARLDQILSSEQAWADAANKKRAEARTTIRGFAVVGVVAIVVLVVAPLVFWRRYRAAHAPAFDDDYFRDVPGEGRVHPAVLGCLHNGGNVEGELFTATLMKLTDDGVVTLEVVRDKKGRERDYEIGRRGDAAAPHGRAAGAWAPGGMDGLAGQLAGGAIDDAALSLLFDVVAPRGKGRGVREEPSGGYDSLLFSDVERAAKRAPSLYSEGIEAWQAEVKGACEAAGYFTDERGTGAIALGVISVLATAVGSLAAICLLLYGALPAGLVILLASVALAVANGFVVSRLKPLSREAMELRAQLVALRRWLTEFTLLDEAVPSDVVLWNRLLVMAVALGVADRVIKQLETAMPQLFDDPYFYPCYCWCHGYGHMHSPSHVFNDVYGSAHTVTVAELAQSSSSSGAGLGGGFSAGGEGGGGGGGGGAF